MPEGEGTTSISFSAKAPPARARRYTLGSTKPTAEGGQVGVGVDRNGNPFLVHEIGRSTEAVALHAVATAIAAGAIPASAVVAAYVECGNLGELQKAMPKPSK